jgi:hypothetical protein
VEKVRKEELRNFALFAKYNDQVEEDEMGGACSLNSEEEDEKTPLERPRRRWPDNIRTDLGEIGLGGVDWIGLAQDRDRWRALVNAVMNLRVP